MHVDTFPVGISRTAGPRTRRLISWATAFLVAGVSPALTAQSWVFRHDDTGNDNDLPTTSLRTPDDAVIVAGNTGTGGAMDFLILKVDAGGQQVWRQRLDGGGNNQDILYAAALDGAGDVLVTGRSQLSSNSDYYTAKLRGTDGAVLWTARADGVARSIDQANAVAVGPANEVVVTGLSYGSSSGQDYLTIQYDTNGKEQWRKVYQGPGPMLFDHDAAESVAVDANGDVFVTGQSSDASGITDYMTLKYQGRDGSVLWSRRYTGSGANDVAYRVVLDANGDALVSGESFQGGYRIVTLGYDGANGSVQWTAMDAVAGRIQLRDLLVDGQGSWFLTASSDPDSNSSNVNEDVYVARHSTADGTLTWSTVYGGKKFNQYEVPARLDLAPDGDVVVAGSQIVPGSILDVLYLRLRGSDGRLLCNALYDAPFADADGGAGIHALPTGEIFLVGVSNGGRTKQDYLVLFYSDDDLVLSPNRSQLRAGDELQLDVSPGAPGSPTVLAVVAVNGAPWFQIVATGKLSNLGRYRLSAVVPPGVTGLEVDLQAYSVARSGAGAASNQRSLLFQ